jgi:hypothetical protein
MYKPIQFTPEVEELVGFVEETAPNDIIEATLAKLRGGVTAKQMLTASALAVVRSTDLPPQHHGGPVHPICGVHAIYHTSQRLSGEQAYLPVVQHTALCNNHVNSHQMGPYIMPEIEAVEGSASDVGSYHLTDEYPVAQASSNGHAEGGVAGTSEAFVKSIATQNTSAAEHYGVWLLEHLSPGEFMDLLLPIAISRNHLDDHYFIYPMFTARALDCIGWEWAPVLMRPAIKFLARNPTPLGGPDRRRDYEAIEELVENRKLLEMDIPTRTSDAESEAIGDLGARIGACRNYYDAIEMMIDALAGGLSLEGAGEALSLGAATIYMSSSYGNPMDSHLHTGSNNRRYLIGLEGVGLPQKILGLLTGLTGPEVTSGEEQLNWSPTIDAGTLESLPELGQDALLDSIEQSIEAQPWSDWRSIGVDNLVAPNDVHNTVALAQQYYNCGYDPDAFFSRIAELNSRDDFTEMHALKHHQATAEEFYSTRAPLRSVHMLSTAKSSAVVHGGREHKIYQRTRELLQV